MSSRPDVTPPDYLKELEKLQDQIPAFDSKKAMKMMEEELGCPTSRIFSSLATLPTAAASLGQVCFPGTAMLAKNCAPKAGQVSGLSSPLLFLTFPGFPVTLNTPADWLI